MPSYLYQAVPVQIQPFEHPLNLYQAALQTKDAKFKAGLSNIRNRYDSILSTPLTNIGNQLALRSGMENAMNKLSSLAVGDLSLPENQAGINSVFDPILDNKDIMYDAAWTKNYQREIAKAENLQKTKPELVPPQNLEPIYMAHKAYQNGNGGERPGFVKFTPYYDFNTKLNTELDKIKADIDNQIVQGKGLRIQGPDGSTIDIDNITQQQVKEIKEAKVMELAWKRLQTDPQALNQMSLDYSYNTNHGFYSASQAAGDIDGDIQNLKDNIEYYKLAASAGKIDKDKADGYIKGLTSRIEDLGSLKNEIKINPDNARKYYTFNKSVKDYVESKVRQYAYKEEGKLEDVPGYSQLRDFQFDVIKEQWKAKFDVDKEAKKAQSKSQEATTTVLPYKDLLINLEESPTGKITAAPSDVAAIGNFHEKNGKFYHSFAQQGENNDPRQQLIILPASGELTDDQAQTLSKSQVWYGLNRDLETLGIKKNINKGPSFGSVAAAGDGFVSVNAEGIDIIKNLSLNPDFYGKNSEVTNKINTIVSKYQPVLAQLGVDLKNEKSYMSIQKDVKNANIEKSLRAGETLNKLTGDFQVAFASNNVVKGSSDMLYVAGKVIVPVSRLNDDPALPSADALIEEGLATAWNTTTSGGDDDGKYVKSNERQIAINFYKPVTGNVEDINDRMLMQGKRLEGLGEKTFGVREASRTAARQFAGLVERAGDLRFDRAGFVLQDGNYTINQATYNNKDVMNSINSLAWDISVRTGIPSTKVQQDVSNILAINRNPLRRAEALENLEYNYNIQNQVGANGFRSFATYEEGRKALEDQLKLYQTGQTRQNLGPNSTLLEAMNVYAPSSDNNDPAGYAKFIADRLGVTVNTKISDLDTKKWADAIEKMEGNTKGNNPGNLRPAR